MWQEFQDLRHMRGNAHRTSRSGSSRETLHAIVQLVRQRHNMPRSGMMRLLEFSNFFVTLKAGRLLPIAPRRAQWRPAEVPIQVRSSPKAACAVRDRDVAFSRFFIL